MEKWRQNVAFILKDMYLGDAVLLQRGDWVYCLHQAYTSADPAWIPMTSTASLNKGEIELYSLVITRKKNPSLVIVPNGGVVSVAERSNEKGWWVINPPSKVDAETKIEIFQPFTGGKKVITPDAFKDWSGSGESLPLTTVHEALWRDTIWRWSDTAQGFRPGSHHQKRR